MDFYGNEIMAQIETRRRLADLDREAQRSIASRPAGSRRDNGWSKEFTAWVAERARTGVTFMARTPANP